MAFRGVARRKDVKKQSYYVWFLGAKESKGLRGEEYIRPVLRHLVDKERELEPTKVTLQVSGKGLKIVQNVPRKGSAGAGVAGRGGKTEQIKHFIPHHAITCAVQECRPNDDVVCCILLIYNPLTRCPVHVHAYRCDSVETARMLRAQLHALVERPDNQKKFREIENRLAAKGLLAPARGALHSDGRSTRTDGSDRTEDSSAGSSERDVGVRKEHIASLYDSLAAELRERLNNKNSCPILLPPKDYDTVSRRQGRLDGIEGRRSTHYTLVGGVAHRGDGTTSNWSSSGIGSDEALSSAIQEVASHPDFESKEVDPDTSSDEEDADDWPRQDELDLDDDDEDEEDEVVPSYEWRPPRYAARRSRSSPEDDDVRYLRGVRGIVDHFEKRAASPRDFEAAYRRHSNPPRPLSYPAAPRPPPLRRKDEFRPFRSPSPQGRPRGEAERRRSAYFDLPLDPRDYRHSFVESPFRRLPLDTTQY